MIKEFVWRVFEKTGNIDNYMLFKQIEDKDTVQSGKKIEDQEIAVSK
jgi:hypothetical protein